MSYWQMELSTEEWLVKVTKIVSNQAVMQFTKVASVIPLLCALLNGSPRLALLSVTHSIGEKRSYRLVWVVCSSSCAKRSTAKRFQLNLHGACSLSPRSSFPRFTRRTSVFCVLAELNPHWLTWIWKKKTSMIILSINLTTNLLVSHHY